MRSAHLPADGGRIQRPAVPFGQQEEKALRTTQHTILTHAYEDRDFRRLIAGRLADLAKPQFLQAACCAAYLRGTEAMELAKPQFLQPACCAAYLRGTEAMELAKPQFLQPTCKVGFCTLQRLRPCKSFFASLGERSSWRLRRISLEKGRSCTYFQKRLFQLVAKTALNVWCGLLVAEIAILLDAAGLSPEFRGKDAVALTTRLPG